MTTTNKPQKPQEIVLKLVKCFTDAAHLPAASGVVDAGVLVEIGNKNGWTTLIETLNLEKRKQQLNIYLMPSLNA